MNEKELRFYCSLFTGQGRNRRVRYCKSVDWVDDQIVFTFSDQPCSVSSSVSHAFKSALRCVSNAPFRRFHFSSTRDENSVREFDFYWMADAVRSFLDDYGCEAFNELINQVPGSAEAAELSCDEERLIEIYRKYGKKFLDDFLASVSEEVTPDA